MLVLVCVDLLVAILFCAYDLMLGMLVLGCLVWYCCLLCFVYFLFWVVGYVIAAIVYGLFLGFYD